MTERWGTFGDSQVELETSISKDAGKSEAGRGSGRKWVPFNEATLP